MDFDLDHCVYAHFLKGTDTIIYIGSGREQRANKTSGRGYNELYGLFECFYGVDKIIIEDGLLKEQALRIETELIKQFTQSHPHTLTNKQNSIQDKKPILLSKCGHYYVMKTFEAGGFRKLRDYFREDWIQKRLSKYELKLITDETEFIKGRTEIDLFNKVFLGLIPDTR
jgi:hypothetical protein